MTEDRYATRQAVFRMPTRNQHPCGLEPPPLRYAGGSMTTTHTDLRDLSDDELDVALSNEYRDHQIAKQADDAVEAGACHVVISEILAEQSRRLDVWIAEHVEIEELSAIPDRIR